MLHDLKNLVSSAQLAINMLVDIESEMEFIYKNFVMTQSTQKLDDYNRFMDLLESKQRWYTQLEDVKSFLSQAISNIDKIKPSLIERMAIKHKIKKMENMVKTEYKFGTEEETAEAQNQINEIDEEIRKEASKIVQEIKHTNNNKKR